MTHPSSGARPAGTARRRRWTVLQVVLLVALVAGAVVAIAGLVPGSGHRLDHAAAGWLVIAVALELAACTGYALLFHGVFSHGQHRIGRLRAAQIAVGELGAFVVVPTGAGGPALRVWALLRSGMPFPVLMTRSVTHAVAFNLPYVAAALVLGAGVALGVGPGHASALVTLAPLGVVLGALVIATGGTMAAHRLPGGGEGWRRIAHDVIVAIPGGLRESPRRLRHPLVLPAAVAYWAGDCGVLVTAVHALHGSAPLSVIVLAYMLGQLGNALPLPGGVGGVEPIMLGILTASGVSLGLGAPAVLLYRVVSLGLQAALGVLATVTLTAALRDASAHPASVP